jgi:excisionase family DNA binding protein
MLLTCAEAARQLSLSTYTIRELTRSKRLRAKRYGRVTLIPRGELQHFADSLQEK